MSIITTILHCRGRTRCISPLSVINLRNLLLLLKFTEPGEAGQIPVQSHREINSSLFTQDIRGARPTIPGYTYVNKPSYINRTDDIQGTSPSKLHQPLQKVSYMLKSDDIEGAQPRSHPFVTTRQESNPLLPTYKISETDVRPPTPPKFIRDQLDVKVIVIPESSFIVFLRIFQVQDQSLIQNSPLKGIT